MAETSCFFQNLPLLWLIHFIISEEHTPSINNYYFYLQSERTRQCLLWTIVSRVLWTVCFALLCFVFTWVKCWLPEQQICHMTKSTAIDIETIALKRHCRMQVSVRALSCAVFHWQVGKAIGNRESWQPCHMSVTL